MPSLRNQSARSALIQRLYCLTPTAKPKWGKLDAPRMICHLCDTFEMSLGELPVASTDSKVFRRFPLKHLFLYVLPFPKNAPAPSVLCSTAPRDFDTDRQRVQELINRLADAPRADGPAHPYFGPLTNEEWNVFMGKHLDHHLKQFGC